MIFHKNVYFPFKSKIYCWLHLF